MSAARAPHEGRVEALVFALSLLACGFFFEATPGTNALAHYDQSVSIALFHELSIERVLFLSDRGDRFAYTMDWSHPDEHYYPAKAPGLALAGAPLVWGLAQVERAGGRDALEPGVFAVNAQVLAWLLGALPAALAIVVVLRLSRALGASLEHATLGALAIGAGTIWAPFASVLYAHAPTGVALAGAGYLVLAGELTRRRAAASGLLSGIAVLLSYQAALLLPALALALWYRKRDLGCLGAFVAGGLPALGVHAWYHAAAFGSPLRTAYDSQNPLYGGTNGGTYVATLLEPGEAFGRFFQLTVLPYRGLFFYSPVVILAVICAVLEVADAKATRENKLAAGLALATLAVFLGITALHHGWWGGNTTGPRYLVPALPLLAPFAASAFARWPRVAAAVASVSLANAFAIAAVAVDVDEKRLFPLGDVYRGLASGQLGRSNLASALGLSGRPGVAVYVLIFGALVLAIAREVRRGKAPNALDLKDDRESAV